MSVIKSVISAAPAAGGGGILEAGGTGHETSSVNAATSRTQSVTAAAAINTKGAWQELLASSANESQGIIVNINYMDSVDKYMLDIGIGGAGSETTIVDNLYVRQQNNTSPGSENAFFPINIPAGSRISARCQNREGGSKLVDVQVILVSSTAVSTVTSVTTLNADTADTSVTRVATNTASINTKSSWTEITPSLANDITSLYVVFSDFNDTVNDITFLYDIGTGAASSEVAFIENIASSRDSNEDYDVRIMGPIPVDIASGTRVAFRFQSNNSSATALASVQLLGV